MSPRSIVEIYRFRLLRVARLLNFLLHAATRRDNDRCHKFCDILSLSLRILSRSETFSLNIYKTSY